MVRCPRCNRTGEDNACGIPLIGDLRLCSFCADEMGIEWQPIWDVVLEIMDFESQPEGETLCNIEEYALQQKRQRFYDREAEMDSYYGDEEERYEGSDDNHPNLEDWFNATFFFDLLDGTI